MAEISFNLPDLGEGLVDAVILEWFVAPGDFIERGQPMVEVETTKAAVELPSPQTGHIATLHGDPDDTIEVGKPLVTFTVADDQAGIVGTVPKESEPVRRIKLSPPDDD